MAKVTLDMEIFKALASSTRLQVLRALDERRKTLSELSKELDLNKATVHEHMQILLATGLVKKRDDEGRKWIYYELTWQGERILHPQETTTFAVLLGLGTVAAGGGVAMLGRALGWWWNEQQMQDPAGGQPGAQNVPEDADAPTESQLRLEDGDADASEEGAWSSFFDTDDPDGIFSVLLFVTAILCITLGFILRRSRRGTSTD